MKKKLKLNQIFNISKNDILSIVGSGGKTTLMFSIAEEIKINFNVLVTTSTKIYKPTNEKYDYLYSDVNCFINSNFIKKNGITVISKSMDLQNNKLIGIDDEELENIKNFFDVIIIESDGSKNLPIKGWKKHEPPILNKTNKTIGIIPIQALNKKIDEKNIYGYKEFMNIVGNTEYINNEAIKNLVLNKEGIFKNSKGEKFLFINQADDDKLIKNSYELAKYLKENISVLELDFKICYGSLAKGEFYEY